MFIFIAGSSKQLYAKTDIKYYPDVANCPELPYEQKWFLHHFIQGVPE